MSRLWSDEPIENGEDDLLDRGRFADRVAKIIREAGSADRSAVFGLVGPWGGGKTSLINLVEKQLSPAWRVVRFTPWAASSVTDLLMEFFATIASALPPEGKGAKAKQLIMSCAVAVVPAALRFVPGVGEQAGSAAEAIGNRLTQDKPWAQRFAEASEQLQAVGTPVLVVADDIDRLDAEELAALLKAVRLLGRFPGVHYLLAYDQTTVIDVMSSAAIVGSEPRRALAYLEKIVQYPLPIPPAQRSQLDRMIRTGLSEILPASGHELDNWAVERFSVAYQDLMARTLTTVRSVQRYLEQAKAYLPLFDNGEIDAVDLLVLIHLRLHFPGLYDRLPAWRHDLTGALDLAALAAPRTSDPDWAAQIGAADVPADFVRPVETVLRDLFPAMGGIQVTIRAPARGCRVGNPDYFDRYFALGIPQDDVADALVRQALAGITADKLLRRHEFESILTGADEDRALLALNKALSFSQTTTGEALSRLVTFVASLVPSLPDAALLTGNVRSAVILWLATLLERETVGDPARRVAELVQAAGINAITQTARFIIRDRQGRPSLVLDALLPHVAQHAHTAVIANFTARDNADPSDLVQTMVDLIVDARAIDALVAEVRTGFDRETWTLEDVAARFVSVHQMVGGSSGWKIAEFQAERFSKVVPPPPEVATTGLDEVAVTDIDKYDVTWANRRLAAGRALKRLGRT